MSAMKSWKWAVLASGLTAAGVTFAGPGFGGHGSKGAMLERYDANKDGVLDEKEREAMRADRDRRHEEKLQKYDANRDGVLDDAERARMRDEHLTERFREMDTDKNGVLSLEEFKAGAGKMMGKGHRMLHRGR
jgi:hypothetical protein